ELLQDAENERERIFYKSRKLSLEGENADRDCRGEDQVCKKSLGCAKMRIRYVAKSFRFLVTSFRKLKKHSLGLSKRRCAPGLGTPRSLQAEASSVLRLAPATPAKC